MKSLFAIILLFVINIATAQSFYHRRYSKADHGPAHFVGKTIERTAGKIKQKIYYANHRRRLRK